MILCDQHLVQHPYFLDEETLGLKRPSYLPEFTQMIDLES